MARSTEVSIARWFSKGKSQLSPEYLWAASTQMAEWQCWSEACSAQEIGSVSQVSPTPPSSSHPWATQRAQRWLRLVMTSVVDFKQTWKHFPSSCTQKGIRGMLPWKQSYSLELALTIWNECFLPIKGVTLNLKKNTSSSENCSIWFWMCQYRGYVCWRKLSVPLVKDGFHIICAVINDLTRKSAFSTI